MPKHKGKSASTPVPEEAELPLPEEPEEEAVWSIRPEVAEPVVSLPPPVPLAGLASEGNLTLAEGAHVVEAIHVSGTLRVGGGARLDGPVTVTRDAEVGPGARFANALKVDGSLRWAPDAEVAEVVLRGPLYTGTETPRVASLLARHGIHPDAVGTGGGYR